MTTPDIAAAIDRRRREGHSCKAPTCPSAATCAFIFARLAHLAGRWWQPGDWLDLCDEHAAQVLNAQYADRYDQLPAWLRPFNEHPPPEHPAPHRRLPLI